MTGNKTVIAYKDFILKSLSSLIFFYKKEAKNRAEFLDDPQCPQRLKHQNFFSFHFAKLKFEQ